MTSAGRGDRRVDAERRRTHGERQVLLGNREDGARRHRGNHSRKRRLQEEEHLLAGKRDTHGLETLAMRQVEGEEHDRRGDEHGNDRRIEVARRPVDHHERHEGRGSLQDERLADVVHAAVDLVNPVEDVDHEPHALEGVEERHRDERLGSAGESRIYHAGDERTRKREAAESHVLAHRVLATDVGDLVGSHLVVGKGSEDAHNRHGKREQARIVVARRQAHHEDGGEPLAGEVGHGPDGVPDHVRLHGKLLRYLSFYRRASFERILGLRSGIPRRFRIAHRR